MKRIIAKLKSRRGASLVFALLVFAMCVLAGTAALTAASANIGRYTRIEGEQRQYFSVASALELVEGLVDKKDPVTVTVKYTETEDSAGGTTYTIEYFNNADDATGIDLVNLTYYQKLLVINNVPEDWWTKLGLGNKPEAVWTEKSYTITPPTEYTESIYTVTVDVKNGDGYALEMLFKTGDGAYPLRAVWPGTVANEPPTTEEKTETDGTTTKTITLTYTLRWSSKDCVITLEN